MSEPRRFSELDLQRAARGRHVRSSSRPGRQLQHGPVTVECDFHLTLTSESEVDARQAFVALSSALLERGFSVTVDGPSVVPREQGPRRMQ